MNFCGLTELKVKDSFENIEFPMWVMYPTPNKEASQKFGPYEFAAALDAPIAPGRHPVVMISHGSGSSKQVFRGLARFLALNGYVVGLPEHPYNNRLNNERAGTFENLRDRPRHITEAMDQLANSVQFQSQVQVARVAVIGHSQGGYTALALAGGIAKGVPVQPDPRVTALVLLAPSVSAFLSDRALDAVQIPILMMSGEFDEITPAYHGQIVEKGIRDSGLLTHRVIQNGNHFSFLTPFPEVMCVPGFAPAFDRPGFHRAEFQNQMNREILEFLKKSLKHS